MRSVKARPVVITRPVVIIGADGFAQPVADALTALGSIVYGFLCVGRPASDEILDLGEIPMLGNLSDKAFQKMLQIDDLDYIIAESQQGLRKSLVNELFALTKRLPIQVFHPDASVSIHSKIAQGVIVLPKAVVMENGVIESLSIIGPGAILESGVVVGQACTVGAGAILGAKTVVEADATIGPGAVLKHGITISENVTVGPGAVVMADVPPNAIVFGNPAKPI